VVGKVDEIHNLNIATRVGGEASDTLKYFSERIPATFVLAGISVERAGLLSGPSGEQIAGRYSLVRTGPFPRDGQWATLIAALEGSLRLHRHQHGSLPGLAPYLHERAGGMIGSLLWLIRSAAIQAVIDGTEQVTRKAMDAIPVDVASQDGSRRTAQPGRLSSVMSPSRRACPGTCPSATLTKKAAAAAASRRMRLPRAAATAP
jgi:hypothetical protein